MGMPLVQWLAEGSQKCHMPAGMEEDDKRRDGSFWKWGNHNVGAEPVKDNGRALWVSGETWRGCR